MSLHPSEARQVQDQPKPLDRQEHVGGDEDRVPIQHQEDTAKRPAGWLEASFSRVNVMTLDVDIYAAIFEQVGHKHFFEASRQLYNDTALSLTQDCVLHHWTSQKGSSHSFYRTTQYLWLIFK